MQKRELKSASQPLKVLLVMSSPTDLVPLDPAGEENTICEALAKHMKKNLTANFTAGRSDR
ncbi:hypothetical protein [Scytonema sp. NUACC21]